MDVKLDDEQIELMRSVRGELQRHRATVSAPGPSDCDVGSLRALDEASFLDIMAAGGSALEATLVIEEAAATAPGTPVVGRVLVGPAVTDRALPALVALVERPEGSLCRNAGLAEVLLVLDGDDARYVDASDALIVPEVSRWGYPLARVHATKGESLGAGSGPKMRRAWQVGLAAEAAGLMEAASLHAARYVADRYQFGKPIGSLQSIQHRLARAYVAAQGAKWLARRAAWDINDAKAAAAAACYAAANLPDVVSGVQQVCGAIGFTDEFGLTRYTARMAMLQTELGGARAHAVALGRARWSVTTETG